MTKVIEFKKKAAVDLTKIHRQLQDDFGENAPSYPTLRRWVDAGLFKKAQRGAEDGNRPRYLYSHVKQIYLNSPHAKRTPNAEQGESTPAGKSNGPETVEVEVPVLESPQASILGSEEITRMREDLDVVKNAVSNLIAVQRNLASKYDAVTTQLQIENDRLRQENQSLRRAPGGSDSTLELAKLSRGISQLNDRVSSVIQLLEDR